MSVEIIISGSDAGEALLELHRLSGGLTTSREIGKAPELAASYGEALRGQTAEQAVQRETETKSSFAEAPKPATRGKKKEAAPAPAPQIQEPSADEAAQDAADEAAEEQTQVEERVYTADDVRSIAQQYIAKYGMQFAQQDGATIYKEAGHAGKLSDCKDSGMLKKIAEAFQNALDSNRFKRDVVTP